jgi:hypothetical protein
VSPCSLVSDSLRSVILTVFDLLVSLPGKDRGEERITWLLVKVLSLKDWDSPTGKMSRMVSILLLYPRHC